MTMHPDPQPGDFQIAARKATYRQPTTSPFGPDDQMGMLNNLTSEMKEAILGRIDPYTTYDLAVEFFVGMPGYLGAGDPPYSICMSHTPAGTRNEGGTEFGGDVAGYSGDIISMYTHTGTHFDCLNHFGYGDKVWNGFSAEKDLGSRHWLKAGPECIPPIVTRGVLLDFAKVMGVEALPDSTGLGSEEVDQALKAQDVTIQAGDVVFFRTGRMRYWPDQEKFSPGYRFPGLNLDGAKAIAEAGAVAVGTDCMSPEQAPSALPDHGAPVHSYLLAECGVLIAENLWLEELARDEVYEFAFLAAPIKFRGATGTPIRPFAFALR